MFYQIFMVVMFLVVLPITLYGSLIYSMVIYIMEEREKEAELAKLPIQLTIWDL